MRSIYVKFQCDVYDKGLCENGILLLLASALLGRLCFVYCCAVMLEQEGAIFKLLPQSLEHENYQNALE